jgi:predicted nucleic acid-binding Zn ribbon protein
MIYTYKCPLCNRLFNKNLSVLDYEDTGMSRTKCPHCQKTILPTRVITAPTVIYNGTGFYSSDNRKKENDKSS